MLVGIETGLRVGPFEYRFLPKAIGKNFQPHKLLFWFPKQMVDLESDITSTSERLMFRSGKAKVEKAPDTYRIMVLGGSNAHGYGIENYSHTFSGQLEFLLNKAHPDHKLEFILAAAEGFNVIQCLVFYKIYLRDYNPDLVILYSNINDSDDLMGPYTFREMFERNAGVDISRLWIDVMEFPKKKITVEDFQNKLQRLRFYNLLSRAIVGFRNDKMPADFQKMVLKESNSIDDYRQNLYDMAAIVKKDGARLIFADGYFPKSDKYNPRMETIRQAMEEAAKDTDTHFIPVHEIVSNMDQSEKYGLPDDDFHINAGGHKLVAQILFGKIEQWQLLGDK